jgi:hypothetical protein
MATSFWRAMERAIIRFATLAQAISSTSPTIAIMAHRGPFRNRSAMFSPAPPGSTSSVIFRELLPRIGRGAGELLLLYFHFQHVVKDGLQRRLGLYAG